MKLEINANHITVSSSLAEGVKIQFGKIDLRINNQSPTPETWQEMIESGEMESTLFHFADTIIEFIHTCQDLKLKAAMLDADYLPQELFEGTQDPVESTRKLVDAIESLPPEGQKKALRIEMTRRDLGGHGQAQRVAQLVQALKLKNNGYSPAANHVLQYHDGRGY